MDRSKLRLWLLSVTISSGLLLFSFVAVQQSLRLGLNEPQLQIAEDTANKLSHGADPTAVIPQNSIDESQSLATFVTIVDNRMTVLASSGNIGRVIPLPPASSFSDAQKRSSNWFTWQHDNNSVRDATVILPYAHNGKTGYVLAARSMRQVESIIDHIAVLAGLTLLGILAVPAIILILV